MISLRESSDTPGDGVIDAGFQKPVAMIGAAAGLSPG
jgi:hypothetical protein